MTHILLTAAGGNPMMLLPSWSSMLLILFSEGNRIFGGLSVKGAEKEKGHILNTAWYKANQQCDILFLRKNSENLWLNYFSSKILCALAFLYRDLLCEHQHRSSVLSPFQNEYIIPWLSSFLSLSQLAPCVLMDTSLSGVYRHWFPFIRPTSYHKLIIALPRTCLNSICMSIRYLKRHPEVYVCVCVWVRGAADALMMLIIHTADVRLAVEVLPLGNARTSNSFIVVKSICVLCKNGCALPGQGAKRTESCMYD